MGKTYEADILRFERDVARAELEAAKITIKALQYNFELQNKIISEMTETVLQIKAGVRGKN